MSLAAVGLAVALALGADVGAVGPPVVTLPGEPAFALAIDVGSSQPAPREAWQAFVDRWFAFFDRNDDGALAHDEVQRMFALPLPGGELTFDLAELDPDGDARVTPHELNNYCRQRGFLPVALARQPPTAEDMALSQRIARALDRDSDGQFEVAELRQAAAALRRFDANDDEFLDREELLGKGALESAPSLNATPAASTAPSATLRVNLAEDGEATVSSGQALTLRTIAHQPAQRRLDDRGGRWSLRFAPRREAASAGSARGFLSAQFAAALGDRSALPLAEIDSDPALSGLTEFARHADRNGDAALSLAEFEAFFELVDLGLAAQVWIIVVDRGHNVFPALDTNDDQRLSPLELVAAPDLLPTDDAGPLPRQLWLTFSGVQTDSWGGTPIPSARRASASRASQPTSPLAWFRAMDANRDGVVSQREFIGSAKRFEEIDGNHDQLVEPMEAAGR